MRPHWKRDFIILWLGQAASLLTSAVLQMALIWHLTATTQSALVLSAASFAGFLPAALLGGVAGTLVDRWNRKRVMIGADLFIALVSLSLAVYARFAELPIALILVVLFVRSIGTAFHTPAISAVAPLIVPEDQLTRSAGITQSLQTLGYIAGTAIAGVLYSVWSLSGMVFLDVAGALGRGVHPHPRPAQGRPRCGTKQRAAGDARGIPRAARKPRPVRPALDRRGFHDPVLPHQRAVPADEHGILWRHDDPSLHRGNHLFHRHAFRRRSAERLGRVSQSGGQPERGDPADGRFHIVIRFTAGKRLLGVRLFQMGFSAPFYNGPLTALMQEKIAPEYLGRVFGLYGSIVSMAMPLGLILSGLFADSVGIHRWFFISGAGCVLLSFAQMALPSVRGIENEPVHMER
ncbi:MAG TPA: MFS transporter [Clostridia bacterium]|nr:MFS transporter [Clostridia bacterium]